MLTVTGSTGLRQAGNKVLSYSHCLRAHTGLKTGGRTDAIISLTFVDIPSLPKGYHHWVLFTSLWDPEIATETTKVISTAYPYEQRERPSSTGPSNNSIIN